MSQDSAFFAHISAPLTAGSSISLASTRRKLRATGSVKLPLPQYLIFLLHVTVTAISAHHGTPSSAATHFQEVAGFSLDLCLGSDPGLHLSIQEEVCLEEAVLHEPCLPDQYCREARADSAHAVPNNMHL